MKRKTIFGILLLFVLVGTAAGLDKGYPIIGRFLGGAESARLEFGECKTADLILENGEMVFTIDEESDVIYGDGSSCLGKVSSGDKFKVFLKVNGCEEKEYGEFILGESATYLGTYKIENCNIAKDNNYTPLVPSGSGGSYNNERLTVVEPEELETIINSVENTEKKTDGNVVPSVQQPGQTSMPGLVMPALDPILITLSLILICCIVWLLVKIKNIGAR